MFESMRLYRHLSYPFRIFFVIPDDFFHPSHIVPTAEFVRALFEVADFFKSQMPMKIHAVHRKIFVILVGIGDAGVKVLDSDFFEFRFKRFVQNLAVTFAVRGILL